MFYFLSVHDIGDDASSMLSFEGGKKKSKSEEVAWNNIYPFMVPQPSRRKVEAADYMQC